MNTLVRNIFLFALVIFVSGSGFSQKKNIKKANKDFKSLSYIDARAIYLKVVEDGYESAQIYRNLGDTYYYNSDYTNAAKWYDKLISQFPAEIETEDYYKAAQSLKSLKKYKVSDSLIYQYIAKGGKGMLATTFTNDPDYLKSTVFKSRDFLIDKVGINTAYSDFGPSFYMDNKLVFASSSNKGDGTEIYGWNQQPYLDLFVADMDSLGQLSNARLLKGDINTKYHESSTAFTKDGNTVYFTRNNFIDGKKKRDKDKNLRLKLYKATKTAEDTWGNITELPFNDNTYSVAHPALSLDEKKLYFSSDMEGTNGKSDLWYVDILEGNNYSTPKNLGAEINTAGRESFPFISERNNLYFSSDGRSGMGGYDVFVTPLDETTGFPGVITNLGAPSNSDQDDFGFIIKEDSRMGYVSSNRGGDQGSLDDEIYTVKENCVITIQGKVYDTKTGNAIPDAAVTLMDANNNVLNKELSKIDGSYSFEVGCDMEYIVRGTKKDYKPYETKVQTPSLTGVVEVPLPLELIGCAPDDLGCLLTLQPIYFDFDKSNIRPDAKIELAKILAAMREYPQLVIHIESHTDSRGNDAYNEALSERRAQSTLKWLVGEGIDANRLTAKGYGESQLINECSNGVKCTSEEHQLNRRSMFIIQN